MTTCAIPLRRRSGPTRLEVDIPKQGDLCIIGNKRLDLDMAPGSVRNHNQGLLSILDRVRIQIDSTGTTRLDRGFYQKIMHDLRSIGSSAYNNLGDGLVEEFGRQEQAAVGHGLDLTIKTSVFPLLWEMLYTGFPRDDVEIDHFWGFQHRIARLQIGMSSNEEELEAGHDFLFCPDRRLSHWQHEHDILRRLVMPHFHFYLLDGPILGLDTIPPEQTSDRFIDALSSLDLGMLHLACHCIPDPDRQGVLFSEIVVSWQGADVHLKLHELQSVRGKINFALQPLVFLNACKTMTNPEHLLQGDSFPNGFLGFGASGVIATACDIPDRFAAEFAAKFYETLLKNVQGRSPTISEALLMTRRFFIDPPYYNPLGLAYGLYARRDLHIVWGLAEPEEEVLHGLA